MTKEQEKMEELIKNIKTYIHDWVSESVDEDGYERYAIDEWDKDFINAVETVLSMLKEKDKLINEQLKENVRLQKELNEENKRCMILANNDKFKEQIIDLMAEYIATLDIEEDICIKTGKNLNECDSMAIGECEDCIKQYFEQKATNNG